MTEVTTRTEVTTTKRVLDFAVDALERQIEEFLDDPFAVVDSDAVNNHWIFCARSPKR